MKTEKHSWICKTNKFPMFCICCGFEFQIFHIKTYKPPFDNGEAIECPVCKTKYVKMEVNKE